MTPDEAVDRGFLDDVGALTPQLPREAALPVRAGSSLTGTRCLEIFGSQLASRHLDLAARVLRSQGKGFYTIGSAGHEANAFVAAALRPTDPALLHYGRVPFSPSGPARYPARTPSGTSCWAWSRRRTTPAPAAATRCSAARPSR